MVELLGRRLGLSDGSSLSMRDLCDPSATVSEGFARAYFSDRRDVKVSRRVDRRLLCPSDLEEITQGGESLVRLRADMPPDRVRELWLASGRATPSPRPGS